MQRRREVTLSFAVIACVGELVFRYRLPLHPLGNAAHFWVSARIPRCTVNERVRCAATRRSPFALVTSFESIDR